MFGERLQDIIYQLRKLGFECKSSAIECVKVGRAYVYAVVFEAPICIRIYGAHSGHFEPDSLLLVDIEKRYFRVERLK